MPFDFESYEMGRANGKKSGHKKANLTGTYPDLTAGTAEQLVSTVGATDKTPYSFRASGGSANIGNRETDKLVGGTVCWNQLVRSPLTGWNKYPTTGQSDAQISVSGDELIVTTNVHGEGAFKYVANSDNVGHKYLVMADVNAVSGVWDVVITFYAADGQIRVYDSDQYATIGTVYHCQTTGHVVAFNARAYSIGGGEIRFKSANVFDLTQMFGSAVADYIYGLEQTAAGAGVAWFRKLFPKDSYAYNAGELMSVKTTAHRMIGFNAYNHATGTAKLLGGHQYQITGSYTALSYSTGEIIAPDSSGLFTPSKNGVLTVTGGSAADTCAHLALSGNRNGEYEPYEAREYALDGDLELRGLAKLDANNNLYYDGDTYESDGTVTRLYEKRAYASGDESLENAITDGTNTVVKLAEPTTGTAAPYTNPQIVDSFGTEEYVDARDVAVPVGHETFYMINLRDKLQNAPDSPSANGDYILRRTASGNAYVPLPGMPSTDGTYVLKATVASGEATLSWVSET